MYRQLDDSGRRGNAPRLETSVGAVGNNDVQLGRGRPVVTSEGNQRFRQLILENRPVYTASSRHAHKDAIARQILQTIRDRGGRFLRKMESTSEREQFGVVDNEQAWVVVDNETTLQKVKQALREQESSLVTKPDPEPSEISTTPKRKRRDLSGTFVETFTVAATYVAKSYVETACKSSENPAVLAAVSFPDILSEKQRKYGDSMDMDAKAVDEGQLHIAMDMPWQLKNSSPQSQFNTTSAEANKKSEALTNATERGQIRGTRSDVSVSLGQNRAVESVDATSRLRVGLHSSNEILRSNVKIGSLAVALEQRFGDKSDSLSGLATKSESTINDKKEDHEE